uniref:G-protein coupled receptors family 3 profile domain-containing protein n=1 Tax=Leptobrachium leishanense TaxID=445787 RepID=A0A8C5MNA9_9ANUR
MPVETMEMGEACVGFTAPPHLFHLRFQVSYSTTISTLSNRLEFPSFLRTTVNADGQVGALIKICKRFRWHWIGILISSASYGMVGGPILKAEATKNGVCIAFYETITSDQADRRMPALVDRVGRSSATVVILYGTAPETHLVLVEALRQNLTRKVWLGTESWYMSPVFLYTPYWSLLNNSIGIGKSRHVLPNVTKFLQDLSPSKYPQMFSLQQFWERTFSCKWTAGNLSSSKTCTGLERIITDDITEYNDPTSQTMYMANNAIYATAHALHDLLSCKPNHGPFTGNSCAEKDNFQPWQLLHYLKRVSFVTSAGEVISFDSSGNIYGYLEILNWQLDGNKISRYVTVGTYDNHDTHQEKLNLNESLIRWGGGRGVAPPSICSDDCPSGYRKAPQRGQPVCCYDCILCPDGMISNQTNSVDCLSCPDDQWPNTRRTICIPKVIEFLSYDEPLGLVLAAFSISFCLITVMILMVYLRFRETAMVKANNRSLSYLLLLSLTICFLCALTFVGSPVRLTCTIRQALFGVTFSLCISCILAKTIIVVIAFKATKPGSNLRIWVGSQTAALVVCTSTSIQVLIITIWLITFPPFPDPNYHLVPGKILLECNEGSIVMFYCTLGYLGFLSMVSFGVAFLARNLPDSFNEAKHITFSMLTFLSVWLSFIPAYLSSKGKYVVAVEVFAILLSSCGLLGCIFCPKCYFILFRSSLNTREHLMSSKST